MGKLFGTDGIRGVANEYPLTSEIAVNIGRAVASILGTDSQRPKIILGKDTRLSGDMLEYALASGICSAGGEPYLAGTIPTPGVAYLTSSMDASAGIVISASHNPFYDNGIKIFNGDGYKLTDEKEAEIERFVLDKNSETLCGSVKETGCVHTLDDASESYTKFLKCFLPDKSLFNGMRLVLDCANGATYRVAPQLFSDLGAEVEFIFKAPDGKNINAGCGSEHPEVLIKKVIENKADVGLAFDGDGDRLIAVDEVGQIITGDRVLAIFAKFYKKKGLLKNNLVISTVMSNIGLGIALNNMGIDHMMTQVGDRYVLQQMIASGAVIGGEDSGHLIFADYHTTGDGILTALRLLQAMQAESEPLSKLSKIMTVFPQVLINVEVKHKPNIESVPEIINAIRTVETSLGEEGRVLIRYSGTQPLCRVMVEGPSQEETQKHCQQIADFVQASLA
ncbi:MAG: phosphoglucosamine mutase [bacterium]